MSKFSELLDKYMTAVEVSSISSITVVKDYEKYVGFLDMSSQLAIINCLEAKNQDEVLVLQLLNNKEITSPATKLLGSDEFTSLPVRCEREMAIPDDVFSTGLIRVSGDDFKVVQEELLDENHDKTGKYIFLISKKDVDNIKESGISVVYKEN